MSVIKGISELESTRSEIIRLIEMLLDGARQKTEGIKNLKIMDQKFLEHRYALESVVFDTFVAYALDPAFQSDTQVLSRLMAELEGAIPHWRTRVFKHNFPDLLDGEGLSAYHGLVRLFEVIAGRTHWGGLAPSPMPLDEYEDLREFLFNIYNDKLKTETLAELLVAYGCHLLLALPDDGSEHINVIESFDDVMPPVVEPISTHLDYIDSIIRKIQGKAVLYLDIHILQEGFVLNIR